MVKYCYKGMMLMNKENVMVKTSGVENAFSLKFNIYLFIKRIFDIFCSLIGLICLIPLTLLIKILFVLTGDFKSIFYFHERIGKNGKSFKMFKYRTMVTNSAEILE